MTTITAIITRIKELERDSLINRLRVWEQRNFRLQVGLALLMAAVTAITVFLYFYMNRVWRARDVAQADALHMAHHDTLTGLPNRRLLEDRLGHALASARRGKEMLGVFCIDLDGFKAVNDTYGHQAGDELLRQVSGRLENALREEDTVARLGGDEFAIVLPHITEAQQSAMVAQKIISQLRQPYTVLGQPASIGASVGVALYPTHGNTPDELLKRADAVLYNAKAAGRGRYVLPDQTA